MSAATPETMESAKENVCADPQNTEQQPLEENIRVEMEADMANDIPQEEEMNDPAFLLRRKTNSLLDYLTDVMPWSYAFSCASLFMIPLMLSFDVEYMGQNLPLSVRNLWYTQAVVITIIISVNLLVALLLCRKCKLVKFCIILNYTLLAFYYVMAFILYIATHPYDTQLAMRMFHVACAIAYPTWILCLSITHKPTVRFVGGVNA